MQDKTALLAFWKNYDREIYLKAAILADELGYDSFWVPEGWGYSVFPLLAEMAVKTKNIKLGTGIVNCFSRSPGLIAMEAATLDEISEGRLILGLGTSGKRVIEGFHAREYNRPLTSLRDVILVVRALLAGEDATKAGAKLAEYRPFSLEMTPTRPHIPIYVAALKEKSIQSIGELADGWIPAFWPYAELNQGRTWIAEGAARVGRDPSEIVTAPYATVVPLGAEVAEQRAKEIIAFYIGGMGDYYIELLKGFGYVEECDRIYDLYRNKATRSQAADAVPASMIEALTISGDPEHCVQEMRRRRDFGMDLPIVCMPPKAPWPLVEMFIRSLAPRQ
ncbi:MAG: LLM class flavin-dependent oxidoreductase [Myxococcales bacterium]|nr:LLM class flavin-dependent oxidoreductase [Myxococcales bacterium]